MISMFISDTPSLCILAVPIKLSFGKYCAPIFCGISRLSSCSQAPETIRKCLNEWNATIEALGQGKQSILIRKYGTNVKEFLLYPTVSYALQDDYLNSFQDDWRDFVKENALPNKDDSKFEVKYFARVENVVL